MTLLRAFVLWLTLLFVALIWLARLLFPAPVCIASQTIVVGESAFTTPVVCP